MWENVLICLLCNCYYFFQDLRTLGLRKYWVYRKKLHLCLSYKVKHLETLFIGPWKREADQGDMPVHRKVRKKTLFFYLIESKISFLLGLCDFPRIVCLQKTYTHWGEGLWEEEQRDLWSCSVLAWAEVKKAYLTTWLKGWWKVLQPHMPFFAIVVILCLWLDCSTEAILKILHFSLCYSEYTLLSYFGTSLLPKRCWYSIIFYLKWNNCMSEKNIVHKLGKQSQTRYFLQSL